MLSSSIVAAAGNDDGDGDGSENGPQRSRCLLLDGRLFIVSHLFAGDEPRFLRLPSLDRLDELEVFALDSEDSIFRVRVFDHFEREPHTIAVSGDTRCSSRTIYFLSPIHWAFVFIAIYVRLCPSLDQWVSADRLRRHVDHPSFNTPSVFKEQDIDGTRAVKLDLASAFAFFDAIIDTIPGCAANGCCRNSIAGSRVTKGLFGLELLMDLVGKGLLAEYARHKGIQIEGPHPEEDRVPRPSKKSKTPDAKKTRPITSFFGVLEKR